MNTQNDLITIPAIEDVTRRRFISGALAAALLVACGDEEEEPSASPTPEATTRMFTDDLDRQVEIPVAPSRIVALHDAQNAVLLLSMGAPVVGTTIRDGKFQEALEAFDLSNVKSVGNVRTELDFEALVALQPDLIVAFPWRNWAEAEMIARLSAIAPTIYFNNLGGRDEVLAKYGLVSGRQEEVGRQKAAFEERFAAFKAQTAGFQGFSYAHAYLFTDGSLLIETPLYPSPLIDLLQGLGSRPVPMAAKEAQAGTQRISASSEQLQEISADVIFYNENVASISSLPGWSTLPAVRANQAFKLELTDFFLTTYPDYIRCMDWLAARLKDINASVVDETRW